MSAIEHYVVYDLSRPKRAHLALRDAQEAEQYREAGFTVEGPFVHADQLTGAVSDLADANARIETLLAAENKAWTEAQVWKERAIESGWGQ